MISFVKRAALPVTATMAFSQLAHAQDAVVSAGDTAWILTATALVLFMSLPGLALFYGGLVRAKNYISVLMKVYAIAALASIVWVFAGYSIAFGSANEWWGGLDNLFLGGLQRDAVSGTIPESVFLAFQMTFAIITPANGGVVDFAGGLVVHATAGISALVYVLLLGKRKGFPNELAVPHRPEARVNRRLSARQQARLPGLQR